MFKSDSITIKALDNISFEFYKGLFGHNGAGKTTLLRTLAGVYNPEKGSLFTVGKIVSGFDATGFENIYIRGILFGLTKN